MSALTVSNSSGDGGRTKPGFSREAGRQRARSRHVLRITYLDAQGSACRLDIVFGGASKLKKWHEGLELLLKCPPWPWLPSGEALWARRVFNAADFAREGLLEDTALVHVLAAANTALRTQQGTLLHALAELPLGGAGLNILGVRLLLSQLVCLQPQIRAQFASHVDGGAPAEESSQLGEPPPKPVPDSRATQFASDVDGAPVPGGLPRAPKSSARLPTHSCMRRSSARRSSEDHTQPDESAEEAPELGDARLRRSMSLEDFLRFMADEQGETDKDRLVALFEEHADSTDALSFRAFSRMLLSTANRANQNFAHMTAADLGHPMTHYFIATG